MIGKNKSDGSYGYTRTVTMEHSLCSIMQKTGIIVVNHFG